MDITSFEELNAILRQGSSIKEPTFLFQNESKLSNDELVIILDSETDNLKPKRMQ
jgi:hypothetical protein